MTLTAPTPRKKLPEPKVKEWQWSLRELPRQNCLMIEDFGMTIGNLHRFAEEASRGNVDKIARLEPLRQFFFHMMQNDTIQKVVRHADGKNEGKPVMVETGETIEVNGREAPVLETLKETRSRWGVNDTYDLVTTTGAKKPFPGYVKQLVDDHFFKLCTVMRFTEHGAAVRLPDGRENPGRSLAEQATKANTAGGNVDQQVFAEDDKQKMRAAIEEVIAKTPNPQRRDTLKELIPYLVDNKVCEWDGKE